MSFQQMFFTLGSLLDSYFNRVSLLIHGDSTNGSNNNVFIDSSPNNYAVTTTGTNNQRPSQGSFTPLSPDWSVSFDRTLSQYLTAPTSTAFDLGTTYTIEFWIYPNSLGTNGGGIIHRGFYTTGVNTWANLAFSIRILNNVLRCYFYGTTAANEQYIDTSIAPTIGEWSHVAMVRNGTSGAVYINGVSVGTITGLNTPAASTNVLKIGLWDFSAGNEYFNGYLSNIRIVKGTALYTDTFSPPSANLTAISNTSLLTCQSRNFVDNSANNFAITPVSNAAVSPFNPFAQSTTYSTAVNGGSAYLNGTNDYFTLPNATIGTNNFTIEGWFYASIVSSAEIAVVKLLNATNQVEVRIASSKISGRVVSSGTPSIVGNNTTIYPNAWYHFALVRNNNVDTLYLNGTAEATTLSDTTNYGASTTFTIGANQTGGSRIVGGFLSDIRINIGTAVYTANFTVPSAPLSSVANTYALLNFNNAGVYDSSRQSVLQTLGNVQISTAQSKFGGSSILFNNTGTSYINTSSVAVNSNGQFTLEAWIYTSNSHAQCIYSQFLTTDANRWAFNIDNYSGYKLALVHGTAPIVVANTVVPLNQWNHVALTRDANNTVRIFLNGTVDNTAINYTSSLYQGNTRIGGVANTQQILFNGYMDDIRVTKGIARYTSNFSVPGSAFSDR